MSTGWMARAACADVDPEAFLAVAVAGPVHERQVARAKRVCAGCAVRIECLAWAVEGLPHGVAGGLTAEERRGLAGSRGVPVPVAGSARERAAAGRAALRAGGSVARVAAECEVSERTALRWAAQVRRERTGRGAA